MLRRARRGVKRPSSQTCVDDRARVVWCGAMTLEPPHGDDPVRGETDPSLRRVYHLCYRMTLDHAEAAQLCWESYRRTALDGALTDGADGEQRLLRAASGVLEERLGPTPEVNFELLDETLRSEATRTGEVASITDPEREFLLWELKQGCMTAVVNCLAPGERIAFVVGVVLGLPEEEASEALGIRPSAFKVRLSRARKKIGDYLAPRCGHVDPRNPCHCPSRIGVALRKGFIAPPARSEVALRPHLPFEEGQRQREAVEIYRDLPEPDPPVELVRRIDEARRTGAWDDPPPPA
jgi:RNA polymerase sigma-70 factor (ECF subfamily)